MQVALSLVESSCVPVANDEGTALGSYTLSLYVRSHGGVGALRFNPTRRDNSPTSFPLLPAPSSGSYTLNLCVPYQAAVGSHFLPTPFIFPTQVPLPDLCWPSPAPALSIHACPGAH